GIIFFPECWFVDEVDEAPPAVDLDHGQPLPVGGLERWIPGDVHLLEGLAAVREHRPGPLAEVTALGVVERDPRDRSRAWWSPRRHVAPRARTRRVASRCHGFPSSPTSR